jgi:hypothetical protein
MLPPPFESLSVPAAAHQSNLSTAGSGKLTGQSPQDSSLIHQQPRENIIPLLNYCVLYAHGVNVAPVTLQLKGANN